MPDPTTTYLGLAVPTHGSDVDTWDVPVNGNSTILDNCAGLVTTKTLASTTVTLTTTECQANVIRVNGTLTANVNVVMPLQKTYIIENLTTGNFFVCFRTSIVQPGVGVPQNGRKTVWSDGTNMRWASEEADTGTIKLFLGTASPTWMNAFSASSAAMPWLPCDGSAFSAVTYPYLAAIVGTNTPDMRGRFPLMLDGGTNRVTSAGSGVAGNTLGAVGGSEFMQQHNHAITDLGHTHSTNPGSPGVLGAGTGQDFGTGGSARSTLSISTAVTGITINNTGSGGSQNMPPTYVAGIYMIKT